MFIDFSAPFEHPKPAQAAASGGGGAGPTPSEENIAMVMSLGFTKEQAIRALKATVSKFTLLIIRSMCQSLVEKQIYNSCPIP